jgi:hypothetical protein
VSSPATDDAVRYLSTRIQRVYDALGNQSRTQWSLADATAVRALLSELSTIDAEKALAANGGDRRPLHPS